MVRTFYTSRNLGVIRKDMVFVLRNDFAGKFKRMCYVFFFFFSSRRRHTRLQGDWSSDVCSSDLAFLTVRASRFIQNDVLVSASVYLRTLNQSTVASNVNDEFDPALAASPGNPPGFNDRGALGQRSAGAALQLVMSQELGETVHELTLGASLDGAAATFSQERQEAAFAADRGTVGLAPFAPHVQVGARNDYRGLYFIDQFAPLQNWTLTLAGRYNVARVVLRDRSGLRPALDGDHTFRRFNPALGVNWNPRPALTWFASRGFQFTPRGGVNRLKGLSPSSAGSSGEPTARHPSPFN